MALVTVQNGVQPALYYEGKYFLLPDGFSTTESFLAELAKQQLPVAVQTIVLREDFGVRSSAGYEQGVSIAPYFISDFIPGTEFVRIEDASRVFPTEVELLTQQQYNDRLRERVTGYCSGCRNFGSLTKNDSSLSGHFSEISLNGVCFYRYETRISPFRLWLELDYMSSAWRRFNFSGYSESVMLDELKDLLHLKFDSAQLTNENGRRTLRLSVSKGSLILTLVTDLVRDHILAHMDENYVLELDPRMETDAESIRLALSEKKIKATRKELKKYGVAFGVLEFDSAKEANVAPVLRAMEADGLVRVLLDEPGRKTCLFSSAPHALFRLRHASPALQPSGAKIIVYGAEGTSAYDISFDMKPAVLDLAPTEPEKPKKISRRALKLEEKRVLNRAQAKNLLNYVATRLSSEGCDNTPRFTMQWLQDNLSSDRVEAALAEIRDMGGYCDCELLLNCYDDYDLDD